MSPDAESQQTYAALNAGDLERLLAVVATEEWICSDTASLFRQLG